MKREAELLTNPPKLIELEHPYSEILWRGNREYATRPEETEHFCRTHAHARRRPHRGSTLLVPVVVAVAALVALALGAVTHWPSVPKGTADVGAIRGVSATPLPDRASGDSIGAESVGVTLTTGERKLRDGSVVNLQPGGSARLRDRGKATSVVLDRGRVTLAVKPRVANAALEVFAGAYRFKVIGTRFSVTRTGDAVGLSVDEGRVAVFDETGQLAIVSGGGDWSNTEPAPNVPTRTAPTNTVPTPDAPPTPVRAVRPPETNAEPPKAKREPPPDCRELARSGEPRKAEACYLERSSGAGLDAETALLEAARLRRDVLGDPGGALSSLESYRQRFPNGSLRSEADIAHVVLLARLGRQSEALTESQKLLASPNGQERAFELRLLRGNIYRKSLGNVALAAQEFVQAEKLDGATSEATYLLGSCREELGDTQGAAAAYRRYLENSPKGKRAGEVRQRLERLSP